MKEEYKVLIGKEVWFKLQDNTVGVGLITGFMWPYLVFDKTNYIKFVFINQIKVIK